MSSTGIKKSSRSKRHTDFIDVLGDHPVYMKSGVVFSAMDILATASFRLGEVSGGWRTTLTDLLNVKVVVGKSGWVTARKVIEQVALSDLPSYKISDRYARLVVSSEPNAPMPGSPVTLDQEKIAEFFEELNKKLADKFKETVESDMVNIKKFAEGFEPRDERSYQPNFPKADEVVRYEIHRVRENADTMKGVVVTDIHLVTDPHDVALMGRVVGFITGGCDICGEEH